MAWRVEDAPDTLPYAQQVQAWMERFWRDPDCPLCGQNDWRAEGRLFLLSRMMPGEDEQGRPGLGMVQGVGRTVFPIVCMNCGHSHLVGAQIAGIHESPIPGSLGGLTG